MPEIDVDAVNLGEYVAANWQYPYVPPAPTYATPPNSPIRSLAEVPEAAPTPVEWIWPGYVPFGGVTLLLGPPAVASLVALDLAARVTTGAISPAGDTQVEIGNAGIFSAEHPATLRARVQAFGADLDRIFVHTDANGFSLPRLDRDAYGPMDLIQLADSRLVVVDSIDRFVDVPHGGIGKALGLLADVAGEMGVGVMVVGKLSATSVPQAIEHGRKRAGVARSVLVISQSAAAVGGGGQGNAPFRLAIARTEYAGDIPSSYLAKALPFSTVEPPGYGISGQVLLDWQEPVDIATAPAPGASHVLASRRQRAAEWLGEQLATGPRPAREVIDVSLQAGFSRSLLRHARKSLNVQATRVNRRGGPSGDGSWYWQLPPARS